MAPRWIGPVGFAPTMASDDDLFGSPKCCYVEELRRSGLERASTGKRVRAAKCVRRMAAQQGKQEQMKRICASIADLPWQFGPKRLPLLGAVLVGAFLVSLSGCSGSGGIPNLTQAAPPLPGNATYIGPGMSEPRYSHTATPLEDGSVLIIGGTDEIHLTALDLVEIFDQSARVDLGQPVPESIAGDFIDQDIDGNLITMINGGRFFHTASLINNSENVLIVGGTTSDFFGISIEPSEIYDPQTRTFAATNLQIDPDDDIEDARARHNALRLSNGRILVTGGQLSQTIVVPVGGGGFGGVLTQEARPSTETVEIFDPATLSFSPAIDNTGQPADLTTSRGRSAHTSAQWAGIDGTLNTGDDVYGFLGGFMTLSAISLGAPDDFFPWNPITTKLTSMDYYDTVSGTMNLAQGLVLARRVNDPIAINIGQDHPTTPFGDPGVNNIVFIMGGDSDQTCPAGAPAVGEGTTDRGELVVATFTGFGPSNGVRFAKVPEALLIQLNCLVPIVSSTFANSHEQAIQACCGEFSRSRTGAVLMDMFRTYDGQPFISSVIVTGGGIDCTPTPGGCAQEIVGFCGGEIRGFSFFDPFYDIANTATDAQPHNFDTIVAPLTPGPAPWDWVDNGTALNPLGVRGTVLLYDANIPSDGIAGFADGSPVVQMTQGRCMHTLTRVPGEDGLIGTLDDRVVAIGGTGQYLPIFGDDALSLSCEIFLPPDAGIIAP